MNDQLRDHCLRIIGNLPSRPVVDPIAGGKAMEYRLDSGEVMYLPVEASTTEQRAELSRSAGGGHAR